MNYPLYDYAIIGGDMRQVYLVEELALEKTSICHYALCDTPKEYCYNAESLVTASPSLEESIQNSHCIICPIPLSRKGNLNQSIWKENFSMERILSNLQCGQSFFAGCISKDFKDTAMEKGVHVFDLMSEPSLAFFNTIATAEGAICEAIRRSPKNLHQSRCAVLGYGKCGRTLTQYLKGMSCQVYVFTNPREERAQAAITSDISGTLQEFEMYAKDVDFIFNTIPALIITDTLLSNMKDSVTIIDIASAPGGTDFTAAKRLGIQALLCPGLPGKYAPASSAKIIKETIEKILAES